MGKLKIRWIDHLNKTFSGKEWQITITKQENGRNESKRKINKIESKHTIKRISKLLDSLKTPMKLTDFW